MGTKLQGEVTRSTIAKAPIGRVRHARQARYLQGDIDESHVDWIGANLGLRQVVLPSGHTCRQELCYLQTMTISL
jgi:hypothetical protein